MRSGNPAADLPRARRRTRRMAEDPILHRIPTHRRRTRRSRRGPPRQPPNGRGLEEPHRRRPDPRARRRLRSRAVVRIQAHREARGSVEPRGRPRPEAVDHLGTNPRDARIRTAPAGACIHSRALAGRAAGRRVQARQGRGAVGRGAVRGARLRSVPVPAAGAADLGLPARSARRACGHSSIPPTARASIWITSRRAGGRPGSRALHVAAWHYCEPDPAGRVSAAADRRLPSAGDPGLRLARTAARQRTFLGPSSGVAREDRAAAGRAARLAQAHEPDQSRLLRRGFERRAAD